MEIKSTTSDTTLIEILFERAGVGLCLVAPDATVVRANAEWLRSTGFKLEQILGENIIGLFPDTRDMALALHARARAGHRVEVPRHAHVVDGRDTWWQGSLEPVPMDGGTGILITAREVQPSEWASRSDSRAAGAGNRASQAWFLLTEAMPQIVCVLKPDGTIEYVNPAWVAFSGKDLQATARAGWGIVHPDDLTAARDCVRRTLTLRTPQDVEVRYRAADGSYRWFLSRLAPMIENERVVGLIGAAMEIEGRRRDEAALRDSERRFRSVLESMSEGLMLFDAAANLIYQNPASLRIHGFDPEFDGRIARGALPATWEAWDDTGRPITFEEWPVSRVFRRERFQNQVLRVRRVETGREFHGSYNGAPILDASGTIVLGFITIRDITNRVRAEQEQRRAAAALRDANERLHDADRRKDEFLGMLSHELRNPLAPIRNSSYILRHAAPGTDQARRAQDVIERQTQHLTRLVDDLLDVTRIARGKIELRPSRIDLREVVSHAADDFRVTMHDRGVRFDLVIPDQKLWADADATRITQIVGNLLHNAAKFTRRGDEVALTLAQEGGEAVIVVRDSGAGIAPALLPAVFDPFVQGERTLARTEGGLGLGLALVKGTVELHGGTVRADSKGHGKGSEFTVRLPLATARDFTSVSGPPSGRGTGRHRVLVVDDNADAAESLAEVVEMLGHDADVANDGPTAIEKARANPPGVVLCDLGLPGMSGHELAGELRASGQHSVKLIAVSGYAQPEDVERAIEAGFDSHLAKPCDPQDLERLLGEAGPSVTPPSETGPCTRTGSESD